METQDLIPNEVASSGLITLDLEDYFHPGERVAFDIKPWLFRELILKEKEFREEVKNHAWENYSGKNIAFFCSSDALIPNWAWMLLAAAVQPYANKYVLGDLSVLEYSLYQDAINAIEIEQFRDQRVIVKGCSHKPVPVSAYVEISARLLPLVKSLMYGEACSNVPVFKKKV